MALSILVISNYGSLQVTTPVRFGRSRLLPVIPADRVWRDFPEQGLPIVPRVVQPSRLITVRPPDVTVPVNMLPIRGKLATSLRVDPPESIFPIFMWPAPVTAPSLLFLAPIRGYTTLPSSIQNNSPISSSQLLTGYTPPIVEVPEYEVSIISAVRQPRNEPVTVSRLIGDVLPIMPPELPPLELEISIISAIREVPKNPIPISRIISDILPITVPALEFDISIISAIRETPRIPIQISRIVGDLLPVVVPGPDIDVPIISNTTTPASIYVPLKNPSRQAGGLLLPVSDPQTRLLIELHPLRANLRYGGVHPSYPLVSGNSKSIIWLFPEPTGFDCAPGISIVPVYYTSEGPNVVPVQTLLPAGLPWGFANWCDIVPICIQPPGPNIVPVYEAPNTKNNRVKVRLARPF